ncbi:type II toxin-antitoxin system RelE/ParE family toxin [Candidatus Pacearchaeota archaeon]|nr:type II toxin-antitoxin system RelE/ParE family toxin [Candidatus Pacearchaeota archaeon]
MYEIIVSDKAKEQLSKLPQEIRNRIGTVLERIRIRPFHFVKRVVGSPYYRLRVCDYRIILDIKQDKLIIFVIEAGHRKNVYK